MSGVGSEKFSKLKDDIFCTPVEIDDKNNEFVPKLYETRGWQDIKIDEPITQGLLDSNKTFMLVAGPKNIYTWLGRFTTKIQRRTVNEVAGLFIKDNKMPSNTNIELVYEGLEATSFKQFFPSWKDFIDTKSGKSDHPSEEVFSGPDTMVDKPDWNVKSLHRRTEDWLERDTNGIIGFLPKNDEEAIGIKKVMKLVNYKLVEVRDLSSFPNYKNKTLPSKSPKMKNSRLLLGEGMFQGQSFLHSSNCYVILYKYGPTMKNHLGRSRRFPTVRCGSKSCLIVISYNFDDYDICLVVVYYWQGEMTSSDVRAACALQAFRIEHELSNHGRRSTEGVLIRVEQGREPSHFVRLETQGRLNMIITMLLQNVRRNTDHCPGRKEIHVGREQAEALPGNAGGQERGPVQGRADGG